MSNLVKYYFENQTEKEFQDFYNEILSVEIKNRVIQKHRLLTKTNIATKLAYTCLDYSVNCLVIISCYSCIFLLKILPNSVADYLDDKMSPLMIF